MAKKVRSILEDKKAEQPVLLDVHKSSGVTDYYLVVSGNSAPHIKALCDAVREGMSAEGESCYRYCGDAASGWMVLDYVDVIVHLFTTDKRQYYAIEELWAKAPRVK